MNTITQAKKLFTDTLAVTPVKRRGGLSQWDHENLITQSDEPAVVKYLALTASMAYMTMDIDTADVEIMKDRYWDLTSWEEEQAENSQSHKEYVAKLDNKVMSW